MSVTVQEILAFAEQLAQGSSEMEWRDSTGRAYYAAFHRAQQAVDLCPDNSNLRMGDHERVHARFDLHGAKAAKSISIVLQAMKRYRRCADYEISDGFERTIATSQVEQCKRLFDRIDSFEQAHRDVAA
jgi:uncharacterized protein (UPF0332 family)